MAEELYYILDDRAVVGNCALWWRPNGCGYTTELREAGKYTKSEARAIMKYRSTDKPLRVADVDQLVVHHVRLDTRQFLDIKEQYKETLR